MHKIENIKAITVFSQKNYIGHPESFHSTIAFAILLAQFFGLMPLHGITQKDHYSLKFQWKSLRFIYTIFNMFGTCMGTIFCCLHFAETGLMLDKAATFSFYVCNFFGTLYFIHIARNWNCIIKEWTKVEMSMKNYGYPKNMKKRFKVITVIILLLALTEHLLFVFNSLNSTWACNNPNAEIYFGFAFPQVLTVVSYSHWMAIAIEVFNILATFCWNFLDLFIILLSTALALRFQQVSKKVKDSKQVVSEIFWKKIREDYNRLYILCSVIDNHIGPLVVISFVSNLFFICIQLYNSLKPRHGSIHTLYFFYSFGFLLGRTLAVAMYAAWINDESRESLKVLHAVPSENYCIEIDRLIQQVHTNPAGITGSKFFLITRSFLLKVAGTIVTFELMLLQFGPLIREDFNVHPSYPTINIQNCNLSK